MSSRNTPHLAWIITAVMFGATACSQGTGKIEGTGKTGTGTPSGTGKKGNPTPGGKTMPGKGAGGTGGTTTTPPTGPGVPGGTGKPVSTPGKATGAGRRAKIVDNVCNDAKTSGGFTSDDELDPAQTEEDGATCVEEDGTACAEDESTTCMEDDGTKCSETRSKTTATVPSDDEIAAILAAVHEADVREGDLAAGKTQDAAVRDYAKLMVAANTQAADEDRTVWSRFGIQPAASSRSRAIESNREMLMRSLARARGESFDRAYLRSQILAHRRVLTTLDSLISSTRNADVSCQLEKERSLVAAHLTLACFVLDEIGHHGEKSAGRERVGRARIGHAFRDDS